MAKLEILDLIKKLFERRVKYQKRYTKTRQKLLILRVISKTLPDRIWQKNCEKNEIDDIMQPSLQWFHGDLWTVIVDELDVEIKF